MNDILNIIHMSIIKIVRNYTKEVHQDYHNLSYNDLLYSLHDTEMNAVKNVYKQERDKKGVLHDTEYSELYTIHLDFELKQNDHVYVYGSYIPQFYTSPDKFLRHMKSIFQTNSTLSSLNPEKLFVKQFIVNNKGNLDFIDKITLDNLDPEFYNEISKAYQFSLSKTPKSYQLGIKLEKCLSSVTKKLTADEVRQFNEIVNELKLSSKL
jgi:hypothetical protein